MTKTIEKPPEAEPVPEPEPEPSNPPEDSPASESEPEELPEGQESFDRAYVEKLRKEAGDYRVKAKKADEAVARLLDNAIERATNGVLADSSDLLAHVDPAEMLDDDGYPDEKAITARARELVKSKPHLGDRRPTGEIDQGATEEPEAVESLASILRARAT